MPDLTPERLCEIDERAAKAYNASRPIGSKFWHELSTAEQSRFIDFAAAVRAEMRAELDRVREACAVAALVEMQGAREVTAREVVEWAKGHPDSTGWNGVRAILLAASAK